MSMIEICISRCDYLQVYQDMYIVYDQFSLPLRE